MRRRAQPLKTVVAVAFLAAALSGCVIGHPRTALVLVIENRSPSALTIEWPDVTGSNTPDSVGSCARIAKGIEPGIHSIVITSSTDREMLSLNLSQSNGPQPERWVVVDSDGTINLNAIQGSSAAPVC